MQRREFITLVGGAAGAWPLAVRAQQPSGRPLIALLSPLSAATATRNIAGLRNGLRDLGLVEGRNIFLALRFAGGGMAERMPALARELIDLIGQTPASTRVACWNVSSEEPRATSPRRPNAVVGNVDY